MTAYRLISEPQADLDIEAAFNWYENEQVGLGLEFLDELRATYGRIADGPLKYQDLRGGFAGHCFVVFRTPFTSPSKVSSRSFSPFSVRVMTRQNGSGYGAEVPRAAHSETRRPNKAIQADARQSREQLIARRSAPATVPDG